MRSHRWLARAWRWMPALLLLAAGHGMAAGPVKEASAAVPGVRTVSHVPQPVSGLIAPQAHAQLSTQALDRREIRAQLMPRRYTTLAAEIGAKVSHLPIEEGARFRAGDKLIGFDCALQQTQLHKAQAAQDAADKTWKANQRLEELNAVGKVELGISEAEVAKARADVASYKVLLSKCAVTAPFAGRVAEQKVREQQYVQPGQPLLDILDDTALELEFIVPSKWLIWLKPRHGFQVLIDETGKSYPARVQRIGARVDPVSQSVKLSAIVDGRFNELIAGMSGKVVMTPPAGP